MTTLALRSADRLDRRVLGALRCVDAATRLGIEAPLLVRIAGAQVLRNRSGLYVIHHADALAAHAETFDAPPAAPAVGDVKLQAVLADPTGRYLPRRARIALPRDPSPAADESLFRPIEIAMVPAANARTGANWALLRLTVREAGGDALGGALAIVSSAGRTLARGLTDWRGEALVAVPGVPVTTWASGAGAVVASEIAATLDVVFDPAAGQRRSAADVRDGRAPATLPTVDPDVLEEGRAALPSTSLPLALATGRTETLSLTLALP